MKTDQVHIVELEEMTVASTYGFGHEPETEAWDKMWAFLRATGRIEALDACRFYGFNNPDPSTGSPNYGYEQWVTVESGAVAAGDVTIKTFPGGTYAVLRCEGLQHIGDRWKELVLWRENTSYLPGTHQWLERILNPEVFLESDGDTVAKAVFDLYLPVVP